MQGVEGRFSGCSADVVDEDAEVERAEFGGGLGEKVLRVGGGGVDA